MQKTWCTHGVLLAAILIVTSSAVRAQKPVINLISPAAAAVGGVGLTITLNGSNFGSGCAALWNGVRRLSTFINSNQLQMVVAASDLAAAGQASIQVTNASGTSNPVYFTIIAPAGFAITTSTLPNGTAGALYSTALAAAGGTPPYVWSGNSLPTGLALSPSGAVSGTIVSAGSYSLVIIARDAANLAVTKTYALKIDFPAGLTIATPSLPNGIAGTPYNPTTLNASGGTTPYNWTIAKGELPRGMALSPNGILSGTPNASAAYSFAIQVTDSAKNSAVLTYSLTITSP